MEKENFKIIEHLIPNNRKEEILKLPTEPLGRCKNLAGQKFNRLLVLDKHCVKNQRIYWWSLCDCGNIVSIRGDHMTSGHTKSCGCYALEVAASKGRARALDLTQQIFGYLKPIKPTEKRAADNSIIWECLCINDNVVCEISSNSLRTGKTQSCGCMKESHGELKVKNLLLENNIPFVREKTMFKFETSKNARFDFWVNNQYLIEYDGEIHYQATSGWNTKESLEKRQMRDRLKNQWCKDNNIPLIRIPYWHLKDLCIEDLLLETSSYII